MRAVLPIPSLRNDRPAAAAAIREIVFGVEDGTVQNMTLVAGMVGATLGNSVILLAGFINAIAGVVSMSMGTYMSSKAERDVASASPGSAPTTDHTPIRDATVMAGAYAAGAVVPILPFAVPAIGRALALGIALGFTMGAMYLLGAATARLSGRASVAGGIEMLSMATIAGLAGYAIGLAARSVFGLDF